MNNSRIWLVVSPTVGLPLFFGAIATVSLLVHYTILTNGTYFAAFIAGGS